MILELELPMGTREVSDHVLTSIDHAGNLGEVVIVITHDGGLRCCMIEAFLKELLGPGYYIKVSWGDDTHLRVIIWWELLSCYIS